MAEAHGFLKVLTTVLCVAAVTTLLFQRLKQPVVLGYVLAGLIVGPHVPIPLVADREIVQTLSELGVILLIFALGLEFSVRKLIALGPSAGVTAVIQSSFMVWVGFVTGRAFGWTPRESLFAGAIIAISSTTIIAKAFDEQHIRGKLRELVVGVLVVEDLIAILLMALLTAVASGERFSAATLLESGGRLLAFLLGLLVVGLLTVPRGMRALARLNRPETTLIASMGICFFAAVLAEEMGYSVALGAFIAGSLIAESGEEKQVERLILPVRDVFGAIFFVSVGMLIDPVLIARHWPAVAVLTAIVIFGKVFAVSLGALLAGNGTRTSVQAGMSLAQIGEFSFIIAGLGVALDATRDFLYPVAVAVSALTTLTTPWLIRHSDAVASFVDRRLPQPLQTFVSLYGSWLERLRSAPRQKTGATIARRLIKLLLLDTALLAALVIFAALYADEFGALLARKFGIGEDFARWAAVAVALTLAAPFVFGVVRIARGLGVFFARAALPERQDGALDLALAPRRVLVVTVELAVVLLVGLPLLALTQPFVRGGSAAIVFGLVVALLAVVFWRNAASLHGHVRAGAQVVLEALAARAKLGEQPPDDRALAELSALLPGLGEPVALRLDERSPAVGKTLAELDLRCKTSASVLAIARGEEGVIVPTATEVLRAGDVLALAGTREAVAAARDMLSAES
jgi:K+:H+ antiporter